MNHLGIATNYSVLLLFAKTRVFNIFSQAKVRLHAAVLPQEGSLPARRILLEEEEGREDHQGGPHEAKGPGDGGER